MSRTFVYARVSTVGQTTAQQVQEIISAGYAIEENRIVEETISGSVQAMQRPLFSRLVADRMEAGDVLIVTKLDRLGRNSIDVQQTVQSLEARQIRVHCLQLGGADLTSPAGKMTMGVIAAVAEFERDLLRERTKSGLNRVKAEGKKLGRPRALNDKQRDAIIMALANHETVQSLSFKFGTDRRNIQRLKASLKKDEGSAQ